MLLVNKLMFIVKKQTVLNDYIFAKLQNRKNHETILVAAIYVPLLDTEMRLVRCLSDLQIWLEDEQNHQWTR
jgi:hypothetical protein